MPPSTSVTLGLARIIRLVHPLPVSLSARVELGLKARSSRFMRPNMTGRRGSSFLPVTMAGMYQLMLNLGCVKRYRALGYLEVGLRSSSGLQHDDLSTPSELRC